MSAIIFHLKTAYINTYIRIYQDKTMANNPLQQYFRQPKIYIKIPTGGVYTKPGTISGDVNKIPVYGMTGMDEIILKTPDALLSGESTANVIKSCCPSINDPWELSNIDIDCLLTAIRIATYGNKLSVNHKCKNPECEAENEYDLDLGNNIDHYSHVVFDPKIILDSFIIKIKPLDFKEANQFNLENFQLQRQLAQVRTIENEESANKFVKDIFEKLADVQKRIIYATIESIELPGQVVTERNYIKEFVDNCDSEIFTKIKDQFEQNTESWNVPATKIKCASCGTEDKINIELNQTTFFAGA
jgi:hypothetical protein